MHICRNFHRMNLEMICAYTILNPCVFRDKHLLICMYKQIHGDLLIKSTGP